MASINDETFLNEMDGLMQQLATLWNSENRFMGIHMESKETREVFKGGCAHTFREAFQRLKIINRSPYHNYWAGPAEGADGARNQEVWKHVSSVMHYLMMDEQNPDPTPEPIIINRTNN